MRELLAPVLVAAGAALAACAQGGGSGGSGGLPPPPAYTALTYDQVIAQGGRRLTADEVRTSTIGKTCQGANRAGPFTSTWRQDGTAEVRGNRTVAMTWEILDDGALCRTIGSDRSCQPQVVLGTEVLTFDEQGRHRSTITGCS